MALRATEARQLPAVELVQALAAAVMRTTGKRTTSILGTTDAARGDFRRDKVSILGATSFPSAQKVSPLVAQPLGDLRQQLPQGAAHPGLRCASATRQQPPVQRR